jgi:hypothetical protein
MRTATRLYTDDPFSFQGLVPNKELSILFGVNIIGYDSDLVIVA